MQIRDNTFLVTGGASGLGAGVARALVGRRRPNCFLADVDQAAGEALAAELGSARPDSFAPTSPAKTTSSRAVDAARQSLGPLSGVVQCAGILGAARIVGKEGPHDLALFRRVVEVNLIGTFNVMRLAAAAMAANEPNSRGRAGSDRQHCFGARRSTARSVRPLIRHRRGAWLR